MHFTSGTTGLPKGAAHVHAAAVGHFATGKYVLDLHEDDHETRTYVYSFGDPALAKQVVGTLATFIPVAEGALTHTRSMKVVMGEIRDHHDGSAEDFMSHQGTCASLASETPTRLPLLQRMAVGQALVDVCLGYAAHARHGRKGKDQGRGAVH
jgi:acyl-CoA synthetase (AMP-forming)/AMP-acid ligase II